MSLICRITADTKPPATTKGLILLIDMAFEHSTIAKTTIHCRNWKYSLCSSISLKNAHAPFTANARIIIEPSLSSEWTLMIGNQPCCANLILNSNWFRNEKKDVLGSNFFCVMNTPRHRAPTSITHKAVTIRPERQRSHAQPQDLCRSKHENRNHARHEKLTPLHSQKTKKRNQKKKNKTN